jgi:chemotaxis protein methyltransferase CheR
MMDRAWSHSVLQALAASIRNHAGLSFVPSRYDELERRTRRAMAKAGVTSVHDYTDGLRSGRLSFDDWVAELTVGETYFLREPGHFEFIRRHILPGLLALHGMGHVFRVWSAGCASGEEAYSLAILFEEQRLGRRLHLVGTDVSRAALAKARRGIYGAWSMRGAADGFVDQYFVRRDHQQFELAERFRQQVTFEYLNLALDGYPSFFTGVWGNDLILCRNVMIYFERETTRMVARRLFESLADGGWLMTGPSDPPLGDYAPYETVLTESGVFYRRGRSRTAVAVPVASTALAASAAPDAVEDAAPRAPPAVSLADRPCGKTEPRPAADFFELATAAFAAGDYDRAIELACSIVDHAGAAALEVRATANLLGARVAARFCAGALLRFPLSAELYALQTSLLLDVGDYDDAAKAARRLLYLDRSLIIAHLLLGSILGKCGDHAEAVRAFRRARDLAGSLPMDDVVPFADGEKAGRLADFARAQMQLLGNDARSDREGEAR